LEDGASSRPAAVDRRRAGWVLVPWATTALIVPVILSFALFPFFEVQSSAPVWPAIEILAAVGLLAIPRRTWRTVGIAAVGVMLAGSLAAVYVRPQAEDWRSAAAYLDEHASPGELVVFIEGVCGNSTEGMQCSFDYYTRRPDLREFPFVEGYRDVVPSDLPALDHAIHNESSLWVAYGEPSTAFGDTHDLVAGHLAQGWTRDVEAQFFRVRLTHWSRQPG
jgi:hypothetical protein